MRIQLRNGFLLASTLAAGTCAAEPALAQDSPRTEKPAPVFDVKNQRPLRFNLQPAPQDGPKPFLETDLAQEQEKSYREQRFGKNVELAEGVRGTFRPMRFTLTISFP